MDITQLQSDIQNLFRGHPGVRVTFKGNRIFTTDVFISIPVSQQVLSEFVATIRKYGCQQYYMEVKKRFTDEVQHRFEKEDILKAISYHPGISEKTQWTVIGYFPQ